MKEKPSKAPPVVGEYPHELSNLVGCICKNCRHKEHEFDSKSRLKVFICQDFHSNAPKTPEQLQELSRQNGNRRECPHKKLINW